MVKTNRQHNIFRFRRRKLQIEELDALRKELAEAKKAAAEAESDAAAAITLAEEEIKHRKETEELFRLQTDELKEAVACAAVLETKLACLAPQARRAELDRAASARMALPVLPETPTEVLKYFQTAFCDRLIITEEAFALSKACTIPADQVYKCLFAVGTQLTDLLRANCPTPYKTFQESTGIHCKRGYGDMTHNCNKYMAQFVSRLADGRTVDTETHITFPRLGQSINFGYDRLTEKIVVGRCGAHPEIYSSRSAGK